MNSEAAVGLFELFLKVLAPLGGTGVLGALVYVLWRTGSGHLLRRRLWLLAYGKEPLADDVVRTFVEDRTSLMAFRFNAGVWSRSLEQAKRLASWLKEHDEDISTIRAIGDYFDRENLRLIANLPTRAAVLWQLVPLTVALVATLTAGTFWLSDRGYFILKSDGLWFSASVTDVRGVWPSFVGDRPTLTVQSCRQEGAHGGFDEVDAVVLCQFLKAPNAMASIEEAVRAQRAFLALVAVASVFMFARTLMKIRQFSLVLQMRQRLLERAAQILLPL